MSPIYIKRSSKIFVISILCLPALCTIHLKPPPPPCSDYEMLIVNTHHCVSRCPIRCVNGVCFEDGTCPCADHYRGSCETGLICATDCLPGCKRSGGFCAASNLCLCSKKGFYFDEVARRCRKYSKFLDRCRGQCMYGKCNSNGECNCAEGFTYNASVFGQLCTPICKQNCGPHGFCHLPNMCACRHKHNHYEVNGRCHKDSDYL